MEVIRAGHNDVKLTDWEFETIVTWIDLNAPYYRRYDCAYPENLTGRSPLNNKQLQRLSDLTKVPFAKLASHNSNLGPQVSFNRPQLSPCLQKFEEQTDPEYLEALAIIDSGSLMLEKRPRADMAGFEACTIDQQRQQQYLARQQFELNSRRSIQQGLKLYDTSSP